MNPEVQHTTVPLTELYRPIRDDLARTESIFDDELRSEFAFVDDLCTTVRSYRGKMLRPALLLLSAKATGQLSSVHHTLSAVIEMVHMATLVHDDVLDEADERRRKPTVSSAAGNTMAVLLGDYLISHAFHLCSSLNDQHASRRVGATTNTVCEGELLQNARRGEVDLSETAYIKIISRKTAALTAVACELGAHYADADESVVESLRGYGEAAGIAFQIMDDVLDLVGDRPTVGKTLGRDLAMGKLTLPTIHLLREAGEAVGNAIRSAICGDRSIEAHKLVGWLQDAGSIEYAMESARSYVSTALANLDTLPPSDAKSSLTAMAEFVVQRQF